MILYYIILYFTILYHTTLYYTIFCNEPVSSLPIPGVSMPLGLTKIKSQMPKELSRHQLPSFQATLAEPYTTPTHTAPTQKIRPKESPDNPSLSRVPIWGWDWKRA